MKFYPGNIRIYLWLKFILEIATFLIIVSAKPLGAQTINDAESDFKLAVSNFDKHNYDEALKIFEKITSQYKYNSKTTASEFFKAKIFLEQNKFPEMQKVLTGFIEKYPGSRYLDEIRTLLVKYNLEVANYHNAFREAAFLIDLSVSDQYKIKTRQIAEAIALNYLTELQLQRFYDSFTDVEIKSFILMLMGKVQLKAGDIFGAKSVFGDLIKRYPESQEYDEAKKLYETPMESGSFDLSSVIVGVMLPLKTNSAGEYTSSDSKEILEGIKFALHDFNQLRDEKVGLLIRDTKSDPAEIKKIIQELSSVLAVKAILGPIYSNEVRITLKQASSTDIPIISPTATDDDLTELYENFFQANPSFSTRGRIMAQYLFYVENKRKISILNSIDGYSPLLAATFAEEFEKLGGSIIRKETFKDDDFSFDEQVSKITADSSLTEGIYIPLGNNSAAPIILTSLVRCSFKNAIYGNQDWMTAKGFETSPQISNNLTFTTDYFFDYLSDEYQDLNNRFNALSGLDMNRNALYGYDAAKYLLTVIRNVEPTRKNITNKMLSGLTVSGYHNNISFGAARINRFLNIVRYKDGIFELVDKFRLNE